MDERQQSTKENPMPKEYIGKWLHEDAKHIDDIDYGLYSMAKYECPNCGISFKCELA